LFFIKVIQVCHNAKLSEEREPFIENKFVFEKKFESFAIHVDKKGEVVS